MAAGIERAADGNLSDLNWYHCHVLYFCFCFVECTAHIHVLLYMGFIFLLLII